MTQFTSTMWCLKCKKFTPHRVYVLHLWTMNESMWVHASHLCIRITHVEGKGKNRKTYVCSKYREDYLALADYNALVMIAHEDFPNDFDEQEVDDEK